MLSSETDQFRLVTSFGNVRSSFERCCWVDLSQLSCCCGLTQRPEEMVGG